MVRKGNDPVNTGGTAPAGLGKRQICADCEDNHIVPELCGFAVETAGLGVAYTCVQGRHDTNQLDFAGIVAQCSVLQQVLAYCEIRSTVSGFELRSHQCNRIAFECGYACSFLRHVLVSSSGYNIGLLLPE
ncbi:hypothetical protein D3C80_1291470 [compost metagenome]